MSKSNLTTPRARAEAFAEKLRIDLPILLAPMSGACPASLSIAVANAGGLGACGALLMEPEAIRLWAERFREGSQGSFQVNLWIPAPTPLRSPEVERRQREFLASWGPPVPVEAAEGGLPDFDAQCQALIEMRPRVISSVMGLYSAAFVDRMKASGILWFATATNAAEARAAQDAGADAIIAQGMEAGGHRGSFDGQSAESQMVGLVALVPQICDAVALPVIATGGIADGRGVAAALMLGASAVQVGTAFLRSPEAGLHPAYVDRIGQTEAHETRITRGYSGKPGRGIRNVYVDAAASTDAPPALPYPVQRGLTRLMREEALQTGDTARMQMWAGQAALLAEAKPAADIATGLWDEALHLIG
jgi:nitronate monooxygenase